MVTRVGTKAGETLLGTKKMDQLFGKGGDDKLYGGASKDLLVGGKGSDQLTGGKGADTFEFKKGDFGKKDVDTVKDFTLKQGDILQFAKGLVKSVGDVVSKASASKDGHDTIINLGDGNKIVLKDVKLADFVKNPHDHIVVS